MEEHDDVTAPVSTEDLAAPAADAAAVTDTTTASRPKLLLIALAVVALVAIAGAIYALVANPSGPEGAIKAINKASKAQDTVLFQRHFDAYSVGKNAYPAYIEKVKETTGYAEFAVANGEDAAAAIIAAQMPEDTISAQISAQFDIENYSEGVEMFPSYTITSSSVEETSAEIELVSELDGEETTWVLMLEFEEFGDRKVWRVKQIVNIEDFWVADEEAAASEESTSAP